MSSAADSAEAVIYDSAGRPVGAVRLFASRAGQDSIVTLSDAEQAAYGEEPIQLFEETAYEFELSSPDYRAQHKLISASVGRPHCGALKTGSRCGRIELAVVDSAGSLVGHCAVQVVSKKIDARSDFREMLAEIAQSGVELVLDARSPVLNRLKADWRARRLATYQRFAFLRGFVDSRSFELALRQVLERPHSRHVREEALTPVQRASRPTATFSKYLARSSNRVEVPCAHPLRARVATIPREVPAFRLDQTFDTQENRFAKFALQEWAAFARAVAAAFSSSADRALELEAEALARRLERVSNGGIFSGVSRLSAIPHGSSVLQLRTGYRELYQAWLRFEAAAVLTWDGVDDFYSAGTRDTALLYEHWVFLQTLRALTSQPLSVWRIGELYRIGEDGLHVRLKRGEGLHVRGVVKRAGKRFKVRLDYNRLFVSGGKDGSWSASMQPDITITVEPAIGSGCCRVHLDAKYRIQNADVARWNDSEHVNSDADEGYRHKREDLLKMHAYRDGIQHSLGAFVLFPGSVQSVWHANSAAYLPAVGAIPLAPGCLGPLAALVTRTLDEMCAALSA